MPRIDNVKRITMEENNLVFEDRDFNELAKIPANELEGISLGDVKNVDFKRIDGRILTDIDFNGLVGCELSMDKKELSCGSRVDKK